MNRHFPLCALVTAALSSIVIVFPWIFEFDGKVAGIHVSVRALGDAVGGGIALLGLLSLFVPRVARSIRAANTFLDGLSSSAKTGLVAVGTVLYVAGTVSHKLRAHVHLCTHAQDLGVFSNLCWNLSQGHGFHSSFYGIDFLGIHANLILWPLSFFYSLGGDARVLLVAQSVFVGMAVPFLWRVTERATGSFSLGLLISVMFVSARMMGEIVENDFHPDVWVIPTTMAALWAWQRGSHGGVIVFGALSLLAKEDACVSLAGFALLLLFQPGWRKTGAALLSICVGVFLYYTQVLIPAHTPNNAESLLFFRYTFGDSYGEWLKTLFLRPGLFLSAFIYQPEKFVRVALAVFSTGGLALVSPALLLPALVSVMPHLLSHHPQQLSLGDLYVTHAQPYLFFAAALGLARLLSHPAVAPHRASVVGLCLIIAGANAIDAPRYYRKEARERLQAFAEAKSLVPDSASLAAQQNLYPHFDARKDVQLFPMRESEPKFHQKLMSNPEFVFCDAIGNASPFSKEILASDIAALQEDPRYKLVFERERFLLFKRIDATPPEGVRLPLVLFLAEATADHVVH